VSESQLASILEANVTLADTESDAYVIIIDGSAFVNSLPPQTSKTFEQYAALDVIPTILAYSSKFKRIHIVFDVYWSTSLKAETRSKRGSGARHRVTAKGKIPPNWKDFMRDNDNNDRTVYLSV
jgi:hypothetical protein